MRVKEEREKERESCLSTYQSPAVLKVRNTRSEVTTPTADLAVAPRAEPCMSKGPPHGTIGNGGPSNVTGSATALAALAALAALR